MEELRRKIDRLKGEVASLPPVTSAVTVETAAIIGKKRTELAEKEEEFVLLDEAMRVTSVAQKHEEEINHVTEECPICLETVRVQDLFSFARLFCCGKGICLSCAPNEYKRCPWCRTEFPDRDRRDECSALLEKLAERGVNWAEYEWEWGRGYVPISTCF
jgi:superfamily II helicase